MDSCTELTMRGRAKPMPLPACHCVVYAEGEGSKSAAVPGARRPPSSAATVVLGSWLDMRF